MAIELGDYDLNNPDDEEEVKRLGRVMVMEPTEMQSIGLYTMTAEQRMALRKWGTQMFSLGSYEAPVVADISKIKYGGKLIILEQANHPRRWLPLGG